MDTISKRSFLFGMILLLSSCSVMPVCQSTKTGNQESEKLAKTTYIDKNTNLIFCVSHNDTELQITMLFDTLCLQKISRQGFFFYFDPAGKKKRDISLKIFPEQKVPGQSGEKGFSGTGEQPEGGMMSFHRFQPMNKLCGEKLTSAIWKTKSNIYAFDIRYSIHPVHVTTKTLDNGMWQVKADIPFSELSDKPMEYLALGVETPKTSSNNSSSQPPMGGGMGMGGNMMGGPDMGGGGMQGGGFGGGNMPGGMPPGGMNGNSSATGQLSSWIRVYM